MGYVRIRAEKSHPRTWGVAIELARRASGQRYQRPSGVGGLLRLEHDGVVPSHGLEVTPEERPQCRSHDPQTDQKRGPAENPPHGDLPGNTCHQHTLVAGSRRFAKPTGEPASRRDEWQVRQSFIDMTGHRSAACGASHKWARDHADVIARETSLCIGVEMHGPRPTYG